MAFAEYTGQGPTDLASLSSSTNSAGGLGGNLNLGNAGSLLGAGAAGAGLIYDLANGSSSLPAEGDLTSLIGPLTTEGESLYNTGNGLQQYLVQGTLPPAFQAEVQADQASRNASLIQGAGSRGQSTNPLQNSALTTNLGVSTNQSLIDQAKLEQILYQSGSQDISAGTSALGAAESASAALGTMETQQQTLTMNAIANLAGALGKVSWGALFA